MTEATDTTTTTEPDRATVLARHADSVELWIAGLERAAAFYRDHPELVPLTLGFDLSDYSCDPAGPPRTEWMSTAEGVVDRATAYAAALPAVTLERTVASVRVVDRTTFAPHRVAYHQNADYLTAPFAGLLPDRRSGTDRRA